jgi:hypothetical protein
MDPHGSAPADKTSLVALLDLLEIDLFHVLLCNRVLRTCDLDRMYRPVAGHIPHDVDYT